MSHQEKGPARGDTRNGAENICCSPIIVHRIDCGHPCLCSAIEVSPTGHQFVLADDGTHFHDGSGWEQIADFSAIIDGSSFDKPEVPVRIRVWRRGQTHEFEVTREEYSTSSWVRDRLGSEAAASVTDSWLLRCSMFLFGFVCSECEGGCCAT